MDSDGISRVPPYSGYKTKSAQFRLPDYHRLWYNFPVVSAIKQFSYLTCFVLQPHINMVWALPTSLAATMGIDFSFSSFGYLDVSVPRVSLQKSYVFTLLILMLNHKWVPPFGNLRVKVYLQLVVAYRSSSRPSSSPSAKAFTVCPCYLLYYCLVYSN